MDTVLQHYLISLGVCLGCMFLAWLVYCLSNNPGVVDIFWGLGIASSAGVLFTLSKPQMLDIWSLFLVMLWMLRLCGFLYLTRIRKKHVDRRYLAMSGNWKNAVKIRFLGNFVIQAFFQSFFAFSFLVFSFGTPPEKPVWETSLAFGLFFAFFSALFFVGLVGETLADGQLHRFKTFEGKGAKSVCQSGLWSRSRHPNYFFEFLVWLSLSSLSSLRLMFSGEFFLALIGLIPPGLLLFIFLGITLPLTEKQALKSRGNAYAEYRKKVPRFFPRIL